MEFGTGLVNDIEDDAFNTDAFKSVEHLTVTKMDLYHLKKGLFNGLESLQILNLNRASLIQSVDMGILDGLNETLKELTIETDRYTERSLPIESLTGSQQTLSLEFVRIRYTLTWLTSKAFLSLTKVKHLDLSHCAIQYIEEGTFDPVIGSVNVLRLLGNKITKLPDGMMDLVPLSYDAYVFMGDEIDCECNNLPINFIVRVECHLEDDEADTVCTSFLPTPIKTTTSLTPPTTYEPSTTIFISSTSNYSSTTPAELTTSTKPSSTPILPAPKMKIKEFDSGAVTVYLDDCIKETSSTLILFVFNEVKGTVFADKLNCSLAKLNCRCLATVKYLMRNTKYSFCVTTDGHEERKEPPLCILYTTRAPSYLQLWYNKITSAMMGLVVTMACVALAICFIAFLF